MTDECELCGRSEEDAEELKEHQGFVKCHRCIREYESGAGDTKSSDSEDRTVEPESDLDPEKGSDDWKKAVA